MNLLEKIISFLQFEMETPKMYGPFHIVCLILTILLTIILVKKAKDERKTILIMSIIMPVLEVYKQLSFSFDDGVWSYQWYAFPFQFCSVPMYVALLASLTKKEKLRNAIYMFLATYGLIAGISVMLYPSTVFIREVLIDIQTMVHHGFMVVMGLYLIFTKHAQLNKKSILNGILVFVCVLSIALIGNIVTYKLGIDNGLELFYISPYHTSTLPVFNLIYQLFPYFVFLTIYIVVFSVGSLLPLSIIKMIEEYSKH